MCRLLVVRAEQPFDPLPWIEAFGDRCRESREYQGHGWGAAWWQDRKDRRPGWEGRRWLEPVWEGREGAGEVGPTRLLVVHARSAFRDEGIVVENNMPFVEDGLAFAFNGELRGVRLSAPGATGAAKLFHLLRRFREADGDPGRALERLDRVVGARSDYVRALNLLVSDGRDVWLHGRHSEDPDYFTLWSALGEGPCGRIVAAASEPLAEPGRALAWEPLPNPVTLRLAVPGGEGQEGACPAGRQAEGAPC